MALIWKADNLILDIALKLNSWFNLGMHYFLCGAYTVFRVYKSDISQEPWFKSSFPMKNQHRVLDITRPPFKTFKTKWIVWNRKIGISNHRVIMLFFSSRKRNFLQPLRLWFIIRQWKADVFSKWWICIEFYQSFD